MNKLIISTFHFFLSFRIELGKYAILIQQTIVFFIYIITNKSIFIYI